MYLSEMEPVVRDLARQVGSPLLGVYQPKRDRVVLRLGESFVHLVPRGPFARIGELRSRPRNPSKPFSFQGACRAHLGGALQAVTQIGGDREVELRFTHGALRLRLTGRGGGLWLFGADGLVCGYDGPASELPELPTAGAMDRAPRFEVDPVDECALRAEGWFLRAEREAEQKSERARVGRLLRAEDKRLRRLMRHLDRDLASASDAPMKRRAADALAAVLWKLPLGSERVTVHDLEDPDLTHTIQLEARRSPGENLGRLYDRAKRMEARTAAARERREEAELRQMEVEEALAALEDGNLEPGHQLVGGPKAAGAPSKHRDLVEQWQGPKGQLLWVGRSAIGNRALITRIARGSDWWMHVRNQPGAHVVFRIPRGQTPQLEMLLAGAQLAALRSGIDVGETVDVQYTQIKHIRPIPGDQHGRVTVHEERVLQITREASMPAGWQRELS